MAVLYGNDVFSILMLSIKKRYFFENGFLKGFRFPENLFSNKNVENVQHFH